MALFFNALGDAMSLGAARRTSGSGSRQIAEVLNRSLARLVAVVF
jgi:hypothetical protein